jgi:hypothetical protein
MLSVRFGLNGYSIGSVTDLREHSYVHFINHHRFSSPGNYHHRYTKQYALGFQVFHLECSDIHYSLDFLFLSHWRSHCGRFGLTQAGEEIP